MKKAFKIMIIVMVLLAIMSTSVFAQSAKKDAMPAYLLSIFLGFGTGHFYLGSSNAFTFLLLDGGFLAVEIIGSSLMLASAQSAVNDIYTNGTASTSGITLGYAMVLAGALGYLGVRIWEIVDIFGQVDKMRAKGKIAQLLPKIEVDPDNVKVMLAYKY